MRRRCSRWRSWSPGGQSCNDRTKEKDKINKQNNHSFRLRCVILCVCLLFYFVWACVWYFEVHFCNENVCPRRHAESSYKHDLLFWIYQSFQIGKKSVYQYYWQEFIFVGNEFFCCLFFNLKIGKENIMKNSAQKLIKLIIENLITRFSNKRQNIFFLVTCQPTAKYASQCAHPQTTSRAAQQIREFARAQEITSFQRYVKPNLASGVILRDRRALRPAASSAPYKHIYIYSIYTSVQMPKYTNATAPLVASSAFAKLLVMNVHIRTNQRRRRRLTENKNDRITRMAYSAE